MALTRRELLSRGAAGAGVLAVGNLGSLLAQSPAAAAPLGPLVADPAGLLDLPAGFSYRIVDQAGGLLPGGGIVPDRHDGTGAFPGPSGGLYLVRNQEQSTSSTAPALADPTHTYDPPIVGGTTTIQLDAAGNVVDEYVSLAGTYSNCAGGVTPWGTWLTCEETETKAGVTDSGTGITTTRHHGYVFEVDPATPANNATPTPLTGLGRFAHEAAAVDPDRGDIYLTEDANSPRGLVYRFAPTDTSHQYGALRNGGTLTALEASFHGTHVPDLSVISEPGTTLNVTWVPVPDPSALQAPATSTRKQFANSEVTRSRKFEGAWWSTEEDRAYIVTSFSEGAHQGQVWSYRPASRKLRLEVHFGLLGDSSLPNEDPDNITVSPYGGLFLAEDSDGANHLLALDPSGRVVPFARNAFNDSEFAGVVFSPDARTLFANRQEPGVTFAITGPFASIHG